MVRLVVASRKAVLRLLPWLGSWSLGDIPQRRPKLFTSRAVLLSLGCLRWGGGRWGGVGVQAQFQCGLEGHKQFDSQASRKTRASEKGSVPVIRGGNEGRKHERILVPAATFGINWSPLKTNPEALQWREALWLWQVYTAGLCVEFLRYIVISVSNKPTNKRQDIWGNVHI